MFQIAARALTAVFRATPRFIANADAAALANPVMGKASIAVADENPARPAGAGAGAMIRWFLANGYSIAQIRQMFPGLFMVAAEPGG